MKMIYPACFYLNENGGYTVTFPDLLGCVTEGDDFTDALEMATDAASGWLLTALEDGEQIPTASNIKDVSLEYDNGFVNYIMLDIDAYSQKFGNKSIRKNCTIPAWLNAYAEENHINFSRVLTDALTDIYQTTALKRL